MSYVSLKPVVSYCTKKGIAHGAFNINLPYQGKAIIESCEELRCAAVIQVAEPGLAFIGGNPDFIHGSLEEKTKGAKLIADAIKAMAEKATVPVVLHLDHGRSFESCKAVIDAGFSSVMIDGSALPYEENVALTKKVVDYAHSKGVSVEGELGVLSGVEDDVFAETSSYTNPMTAVDFFKKTGVDLLALSYGTKHGAVKGDNVKLRKEIVIASMENMRHEHIDGSLVSHGSSLVPPYIVKEINALGGNIKGGGIPLEQLKEVIPCGIAKINMDTDIRLATTRNLLEMYVKEDKYPGSKVYKIMKENPTIFDYRLYLVPVMEKLIHQIYDSDEIKEIVVRGSLAVKEIVLTASVSFGSVGDKDLK